MTANHDFNVTPLFDAEYLRNGTRYRHSNNGILVLVHPKDKQKKEDLTECVYKVPCANCDKIGETGKKFGVRLQKHRTEVESKTGHTFTRSLRASS